MWMRWNYAIGFAIGLGIFGLWERSARPTRRKDVSVAGAFAREASLVLFLYAIWQLAGHLSVMQVTGAMDRGRDIFHAEQWLHLPSEVSVQKAFLPYPWLVRASNRYYAIAHVPALVIFLFWLFFRHRARYPSVRNTLALATGACLAIQLIPVAPPRMFPGLGFVDTGLRYGESVYGRLGQGMADQLSAMPSVHVLWAVLIGIAVVVISPSKWRWLVVAHPVVTIMVVTITANHWWMDGIVAVTVMGIAWVVQWSVRLAIAAVSAVSPDATGRPPGGERPGRVEPTPLAARRPCAGRCARRGSRRASPGRGSGRRRSPASTR